MTTAHTLTPYSPLVIKRYDRLKPKNITDYENTLRDFIKNLIPNEQLIAKYKQQLFTTWNYIEYTAYDTFMEMD